jgi:hypothetical protein
MLHRFFLLLTLLSASSSLVPNSAAVDAKKSVAAIEEDPLLREFQSLVANPNYTSFRIFLKQHPEFTNYPIIIMDWANSRPITIPLIGFAIQKRLYPVVQELLSLRAEIPQNLDDFHNPFRLLINLASRELPHQLSALIYPMIDLMLEQGTPPYNIKDALYHLGQTVGPVEDRKHHPNLYLDLCNYVDGMESIQLEHRKKHAAALHEALPLPPELTNIIVDYKIPAKPSAAQPSPDQK